LITDNTFGRLLRQHRRRCHDPLRGGLLTQERLGELIGQEIGDAGYTGAAISDWERGKSRINADDRIVLISLITVLYRCGGLKSHSEADALLTAGNYRGMDRDEGSRICLDWSSREEKEIRLNRVLEKPLLAISDAAADRRKQLLLLEKVRNFWVKGVLEQSLHDGFVHDLAHRPVDMAIDHPWHEVIQPSTLHEPEAVVRSTVIQSYLNADRSLLILGEPGYGKTSTLIFLVQHLIARAENNPAEPIPVLLSLISWSERRLPMADWIMEELTAKYQIPRKLGRQWLDNDALALMLDGFDEVSGPSRMACARAINDFRQTHGLVGLAICSRTAEYETCGVRFKMGGAIELLPLDPEQVDGYLRRLGRSYLPLRRAIMHDQTLAQLARSPLMLHIMCLAYKDGMGGPLDVDNPDRERLLGDLPARRRMIFTAYVQRMFRHRGPDPDYTPDQIREWLAWLARQLENHNQNTMLIERLQPSWLRSSRQRWIYLLISRLFSGLYCGLILWLVFIVLRSIIPELPADVSSALSRTINLSLPQAILVTFLIGNCALGLLTAVVHQLLFSLEARRESVREKPDLRQIGITWFTVAVPTFIVVSLFSNPLLALSWGFTEALAFVLLERYAHGTDFRSEVRAVEVLSWSWSGAFKGIESLMFEYNGVHRTLITFSAGGLLLGGLRGRRIEEKNEPNQGIHRSIRNSFLAALIAGIPYGLLSWYFRESYTAWMAGLLMAVTVLPLYGSSNALKHYLVRFLLWRSGELPLKLRPFLENAVRLAFMRRVGGGYIYTHHLLREHFASLPAGPE
jgi:hypothetical protein